MTAVDDRDTRFVWVDDLKQMSQYVKYSELCDKNGTYVQLTEPGVGWIRMNKQHTVPVKA